MRRLAPAIILIVLGGIAAPARAAVSDYLGRPVVEVRLRSEGVEVRDRALVDLLETRVGAPLSMADVRETLAHLAGLGRYEDVQVDATLRAGGVVLLYELVPMHRIRRVVFRGNLGLGEGELRRAVVDRYGVSPAVGRIAEVTLTLAALYRDRGFRRPQIVPRTEEEHQPESATLVFDVQSGVRATIGAVEVSGGGPRPDAELLEELDLRPGRPYDGIELASRLSLHAERLRAQGYYLAELSHSVEFDDEDRIANVALVVSPGPRVFIEFQGDGLSASEREELVPIASEHSVDEDLLEDSRRRVDAYLRDRGYRDVRVEYRRETVADGLRIVFSVQRGQQYVLSGFEIVGNASVPLAELRPLVRLQVDEPFVESVLGGDMARIENLYHRRGFVGVTVASQVRPADSVDGAGVVNVQFQVNEGARTVIRSVSFSGNAAVGTDALRARIASVPGQPYYPPQLAIDADAVTLEYLNRGYESAATDADTRFTDDRTGVDVTFGVQEGPQILVDHILIAGNVRTVTETIAEEVQLKAGQPLSLQDINETRSRLSRLGLFRRVDITDLRLPSSDVYRDVLVTVEEAAATTVGYGGGLEGGKRLLRTTAGEAVEQFEFAPRGFFEIGRRNLWGKDRSLSLFTRVSFRPRGSSLTAVTEEVVDNGGYGFNEYRVLGTYRERGVFGTDAIGVVTGGVEQAVRSSFNFNRLGAGVGLNRQVTPTIAVSGRYALDRTRLFDERFNPSEQPLIDRLFPQVRLSTLSSSLVWDMRDDPLDPSRGSLVALDGELAARRLGSEVGFFKTFLQGFAFRTLPGGRSTVAALGARLGLATGFRREIVGAGDGAPVSQFVTDLPASERFYAGGDTTVRGFALDRLGTPPTIDADGFPKGGNGLLVLNAELRVPLKGSVGVVGFVDAGNVFLHVEDFDLSEIRATAGMGVRYRSPLGPIRMDLGFKLDRRPSPDGGLERRTALHISLGQAF